MQTNIGQEKISPTAAVQRLYGARCGDVDTRRAWRKMWKRNGGRKIKSLRTHRIGK